MSDIPIPVEYESVTPSEAGSLSTISPAPEETAGPSNRVFVPAVSEREPASGKAAKDKPPRACDACRLRRVKCERQPGHNDCIKCRTMKISCQESAPKSRATKKGSRIAEAKRLFGKNAEEEQGPPNEDSPGTSPGMSAKPVHNAMVQKVATHTSAPSYTSTVTLLADSQDLNALLEELIPGLATLKISCAFPLFRWIDIAREFREAGSQLSQLPPTDQALYMVLAALAARSSNAEFLVGKGAPSLLELGQNQTLRQGSTLCQYGARRDQLAGELLSLAIRKLNENGVFHKPDLRGVVALSVVEILILVYREPLAFTRNASKEARPFSSAAASHLRILAEDYEPDGSTANAWYSVVWTVVIRDAFAASITGRALDITSNDVLTMLRVNEAAPIPIPSAAEIAEDWPNHTLQYKSTVQLEGPLFMQLWAVVLKMTRSFVVEISQPSAIAQPRLKLDFFDKFWSVLKKCRDTCSEAVRLAWMSLQEPPEQVKVLGYGIEFLIVQAYRIISWRCQEDQLQKADMLGISDISLESYRAELQDLKNTAKEEAFQAARRVISVIQSVFQPNNSAAAEFFIPGYLVYEGLLVWVSLLLDTQVAEDGGRVDYPLHSKISDLVALREAIAVTGWSNGHVLPHLQALEVAIADLQKRTRTIASQPSDSFIEYLNFGSFASSDIPPLPSLPELAQPNFGDAPSGGMDFSLFSLDDLNSASATEWLDAFLAQLPPVEGGNRVPAAYSPML